MKKILSLTLILLLIISSTLVFSLTAQAFYNYEGEKTYTSADGQYLYTVHGGKYAELLYFYAEKSNDLNKDVFEIPSEVDGYPVRYLCPFLYSASRYNKKEIIKSKKIVIPDTVTCIGANVFAGRWSDEEERYGIGATEIVIPQSVEYIGLYAFYYCPNLEKVTLPDKIISIGSYAFKRCKKLESVTIPDGWSEIPEGCFEDCTSLKNVNFPNNHIEIGNYAFYGCTSLKKLNIKTYVEFGKYSYGFKDWIPEHTGGYIGRAYKPIDGCVINLYYDNMYEQMLDYANKYGVNATVSAASSAKKTLLNYAGDCFTILVDGQKATNWKSSNSKVIKISSSGKIAVLKKGKASLSCKLQNGSKITYNAKCLDSPTLSKKSVSVKKNKTVSVKITGKANTVNNKYTNTKYAKITSKNTARTLKIKGLKKGTTTLKVTVNGVTLKLRVKVQ